jgi:hypothetical protein
MWKSMLLDALVRGKLSQECAAWVAECALSAYERGDISYEVAAELDDLESRLGSCCGSNAVAGGVFVALRNGDKDMGESVLQTLVRWERISRQNPAGSVTVHAPDVEAVMILVRKCLNVAQMYGSTDGAHHKAWVIDQMVRQLLGDDYDAWVHAIKAGDDGPDTYEWDTGIAP